MFFYRENRNLGKTHKILFFSNTYTLKTIPIFRKKIGTHKGNFRDRKNHYFKKIARNREKQIVNREIIFI